MERAIYSHAMAIAIPFLILIFSFLFWISETITRKNKPGPPLAGGSRPLIGHLHLLGGPNPLHQVLGDMADKNGPIFTIKMGMRRALIISDAKIAKECLTIHDKSFANRPKLLTMKILAYDYSMLAFCPYGDYWRQIRKISTVELLSNHRLATFKHVRKTEVRTALNQLYKLREADGLVEMKKWLGDITLNVICRIIVGKSGGYGDKNVGWKASMNDYFELLGTFVVSDGIPFFRPFDIGGYEKRMKKTLKEFDVVIMEWLKEHKEKRASGVNNGVAEDVMDLMFDVIDANQALDGDSDTINKVTCLSLILAASDTTSATLTWALSLLVNNPDILKKAQEEIDFHVDKERHVDESDVANFIYLQAIIKETLRLYPAVPLTVAHESTEDCIVADYHIPKETILFINLWKIHRDSRVWTDPYKFDPERFLTTHKNYDVRGKIFELIPFGSGRRMCPGISFALQILQLVIASLLHAFDLSTPTGKAVDMTEGIGLTSVRATPLQLVVKPRLRSDLYQ